MRNQKPRDTQRPVRTRISLVILCAGVLGSLLVSGPTAATASTPICLSSGQGIQIHYVLAESPNAHISGVQLAGFDEELCDGQSVSVTLAGNSAGDATAPAIQMLSTFDSSRNPCTGTELAKPAVVMDGRITLAGCASTQDSALGAHAALHDVTQLKLEVGGQVVEPGSGQAIAGTGAIVAGAGAVAGAPGGSAFMADTGGFHAVLLWMGMVLLFLGVLSLVLDRLRLRPQETS